MFICCITVLVNGPFPARWTPLLGFNLRYPALSPKPQNKTETIQVRHAL